MLFRFINKNLIYTLGGVDDTTPIIPNPVTDDTILMTIDLDYITDLEDNFIVTNF